MSTDFSFLNEVEDAIGNGSAGRRAEKVRRMVDLFVAGASRYSDQEISVFDDVLIRLTVEIETAAKALLALRLAPIDNAPPKLIRALAFDDVIGVAGPVLTQSKRLDDTALVENARMKSQDHLLSISKRQTLSEAVTDVLVQRGDQRVVLSTVNNRGAKFSDAGFAILVQRSVGDDTLAESVGARPEIPRQMFLVLLAKASQSVREKLQATHPHARTEVGHTVAEVTDRIRVESLSDSANYRDAQATVEKLRQSGELDDVKLRVFAESGQFAEMTAAIALMSELPLEFVERATTQERSETVLVLAKTIGLSWPTVKAILTLRAAKRPIAAGEMSQCRASFERLKPTTAKEIARFYRMRAQGQLN